MARISATQAAKHYGISITTITRACKDGKITAEKAGKNGFLIDPAEMDRYMASRIGSTPETPKIGEFTTDGERALLEEKLASKEREIAIIRQAWEDTKRLLEKESEERRAAYRMITDQRPKPVEVSKSWWPFGKKDNRPRTIPRFERSHHKDE